MNIYPIQYSMETSMASMHISLPDNLKAWAESRIAAGQYDTASDYVRDLMRRDQARSQAIVELKQLIAEGFESGPGQIVDRGALKAEGRARLHAKLSS